jgi:PII-like signaling protein
MYVGRGERIGSRPAHLAIVETLHRHGVAGATVLLGVDGTVRGVRRRARFFGANAQVPLMIIAIGESEPIVRALGELRGMLDEPLFTLERVRVCKRDGQRLAEPQAVAATDPSGLAVWQKLMVDELTDRTGLVTSEQVPALRAAGPGIARGGLRLADPGVR